MMKSWFKARENDAVGTSYPLDEVVNELCFTEDGLIPVIAQDNESNEILMFAWMNKDALIETLETGRMCYWSRSRQNLWRKGESSGNAQALKSLKTDCDGDVLLAKIEQIGGACHTLRRSCFYWEFKDKTLQLVED